MSTTFEVFPGTPRIPTVSQVLRGGEIEMARFIKRRAVKLRASVSGERCAPTDPFWCAPEEYLWITIDGVKDAGTDVTVDGVHDLAEPGEPHPLLSEGIAGAERYLAAGHSWTFRRRAGEPRTIVLAFGLLAGVLARLTDGIVTTTDAWDWEGMPATGPDFLAHYFVAEHQGRLWAHRWLDDLEDDFT